MKQNTLEQFRTVSKDKVQVALYSPKKRAVVAIARFPKDYPQMAISTWIKSKQELEVF